MVRLSQYRGSVPRGSALRMTFRTVFDAAQAGYTTWWFPAYGLIFVCFGALFLCWRALILTLMPIRGPDFLDFLELLHFWPARARRFFGWVFSGFAVMWCLLTFASTYGEYRTIIAALRDGRCVVVEGRITGFVPMIHSGHSDESFTVGGQRFAYSDEGVTSGFHNSDSHGGPIHDGQYVRVTYLGNLIVRLEVSE
jgi:hypothetical protein